MITLRLYWAECLKTFLKKRTYLGFAIVGVIVPLVEWAMKMEGSRFIKAAMRNLSSDFIILGNIFNGWFVAMQAMMAFWIHVPILISFVAGDMLAGEATAGTYRLILIKPVSRSRILFAKYLATVTYVVLFVAFIAMMSIGIAIALLGTGDLIVLRKGLLIIPADDVAWRFIVAYLLAIWSMLTVATIAFFISSFVENAIGPIVATMGLFIVFSVLSFLPVESLAPYRDYLFTSHTTVWMKLFEDPVPWSEIRASAANLGSHTVAFLLGAWVVFARKDVLS